VDSFVEEADHFIGFPATLYGRKFCDFCEVGSWVFGVEEDGDFLDSPAAFPGEIWARKGTCRQKTAAPL